MTEQIEMVRRPEMVAELGINDIPAVGLSVVVGGLILTYSADITSDVNGDFAANSAGANISGDVLAGFDGLSSKYPTITRVVAAAIIIGTLVTAFQFRR